MNMKMAAVWLAIAAGFVMVVVYFAARDVPNPRVRQSPGTSICTTHAVYC